jgi:DNA replication protein DnaC
MYDYAFDGHHPIGITPDVFSAEIESLEDFVTSFRSDLFDLFLADQVHSQGAPSGTLLTLCQHTRARLCLDMGQDLLVQDIALLAGMGERSVRNMLTFPDEIQRLKADKNGWVDNSEARRWLVHDLATGRYLHEKAPVLIVGPCGTGKSHLAQALGHCAVRQGVDVVFSTCASLTQSLNAARATGSYERKLATLARVPLLIIDDFGLKPLRAPADEDLHDLIAERYEQAATIVTSNLDFPEWDQAFPANRLLASASLDRLRHNAYCLVLDGQSYRAPKQFAGDTKTPAQKPSKSTPA